ncbi:MAG: vitamin K epoxide reductase family protein [bacterium]|nr:vitamin K epoxide reductase family protein [bacterium]
MQEDKFSTLKKLLIAFIVIATIGFIDASYLTIVHFLGQAPECSILEGCDVVTSSKYSTIGPIPVALLGALYYLTVAIASIFALDRRSVAATRLVSNLTWLGLLASIYFVYLQLFVLKSICIYCMGSALGSTVLFILGMILLKRTKVIGYRL